MGNALFIIWRESAEAMLVVGILYAWLRRQPDARTGMRYLWGGVAAGVGLAIVLALVMMGVANQLSAEQLDYFQLGMVLVASGLIVQMVYWMRRHGRTLKRELESGLQRNLETANWWGMLVVVALAVGRESAETVVFLYGMGLEQQGSWLEFSGVLLAGVILAYGTFWLLQKGGQYFSWRHFFRFSELLLLLLAGALLVNGLEKMMNFGWLPAIIDPLWDSSWLLDDTTRLGGLVAALTGYRAQPALSVLLGLAVYWLGVTLLMRRAPR